ncbi:MAG: hypothetical protein A3B96_00705 [Candidatus Spechtbacteria bacterium RIFCSPHIGHO2_02_FULL_43_15b]|uniref:Uncharacterized protein n=1 Tax=Candidatus Spechtbacteria bacterium RIFCSPHIGHO2_01_FULL_43_30 TaxID=1802158 RepID=A0A1G2H6V5_9BACT|nr:MAG: hypothetical protein A2827_01685 [Candidatus Spechtbacteria bacterium RIFCSPHIGHO2_01_FULL_43_30]OGZ59974.1 MAG: hypothetical protein A3B96_00705 [Candidatus Spechtbacteria bacterium RIFCSPHIGHO2_02_FULL_43_15b]
MEAVIAILANEGLLKTSEFINDLGIHNNMVGSDLLSKRLSVQRTDWVAIDPCSIRFNIKISERGRLMLKARGIIALDGAKKRAQELITLKKERLQALAQKTLANRVV